MPTQQVTNRETDPESGPTLFESTAWRRVIEKTYGFTFHRACLEQNETESSAQLLFATTESDLRPRAVSLPFADYVDTDSLEPETYRQLAREVKESFPATPLVLKTSYPHDTTGLGNCVRRAYCHRVDTASQDTVMNNLTSSYRNKVRQAKRADVSAERKTSEGAIMHTFYELHRALRFEKFGKVPQPKSFFRAIYEEFVSKGKGFVMSAQRNGETIAALVALEHEEVVYYKFSASAKEHLEYRPNNLLTYELLQYAAEREFSAVDLGLSGAGKSYRGLRKFKESFGGQPFPITYFRVDPPGHDEAKENELDDLLGQLTETVVEQRLDAEDTDAVSEILYPYCA